MVGLPVNNRTALSGQLGLFRHWIAWVISTFTASKLGRGARAIRNGGGGGSFNTICGINPGLGVGFAVGMTTGVPVGATVGAEVGAEGLGGKGVKVTVDVAVEVTVAVTLAVGMGCLVGNGVAVGMLVAVGRAVLVGNGLTMAVAVGSGVLVGMMIAVVGVFVGAPPQSGNPGSPQVGGVSVHCAPVNGSTHPVCATTVWAAPNWNTRAAARMIKIKMTTIKLDFED
jgi:hypothetical protein